MTLQELIDNHPQNKSILLESKDWQELPLALADFSLLFPTMQETNLAGALNLLRCIAEIIYTMGYERGKKEATMLRFTVRKETEQKGSQP